MLHQATRSRVQAAHQREEARIWKDWEWLIIKMYRSAEIGIFIMRHLRSEFQVSQCQWCHVLREKKKKKRKLPSAIESLARCRQLVWWNLHWCIRLAVDFYEQIRQQQNPNPLRHWGIIYPFVSAICLFEQETAMRIKQLPAHIGLICSLISACILLPAPTTTTEFIQHLIRHAVSPALLLLA